MMLFLSVSYEVYFEREPVFVTVAAESSIKDVCEATLAKVEFVKERNSILRQRDGIFRQYENLQDKTSRPPALKKSRKTLNSLMTDPEKEDQIQLRVLADLLASLNKRLVNITPALITTESLRNLKVYCSGVPVSLEDKLSSVAKAGDVLRITRSGKLYTDFI